MTELTLDHIKALRNLLRTKSDGELRRMYDCLMRDNAHHIGEADLENASQIYADIFPDDPVPATFGGVVQQNARHRTSRPLARPSSRRPTRPSSKLSRPLARPSARDIPDEYIAPIILISCIVIFAVGVYFFRGKINRAFTGRTLAEDLFLTAVKADEFWKDNTATDKFAIALDRWETESFKELDNLSMRVGGLAKIFDNAKFDFLKLKHLDWMKGNNGLRIRLNNSPNIEIANAMRNAELEIFKSWSDPAPAKSRREAVIGESNAETSKAALKSALDRNKPWCDAANLYYPSLPNLPDTRVAFANPDAVLNFLRHTRNSIESMPNKADSNLVSKRLYATTAINILDSMRFAYETNFRNDNIMPTRLLIMLGMSRFLARVVSRLPK